MNSDLAVYLEYLCSENDDIHGLLVVSNEGLPIAFASSNTGNADQTLLSGMCTALKYISKELISETTDSDLKRILVDCTNGAILIQPLNKKGILVVSCKNAAALNELNVLSIQMYFSANSPKSLSSVVD